MAINNWFSQGSKVKNVIRRPLRVTVLKLSVLRRVLNGDCQLLLPAEAGDGATVGFISAVWAIALLLGNLLVIDQMLLKL
jgi:hypothetical protein